MRYPSVLNICLLSLSVAALPADLIRRQDIDFALADSLPDPNLTVSSQYIEASAISAIIADIDENPLPQKRGIVRRGISGYSSITVGNAAINAPLNCVGGDTYMGSKLWNDQFFDETRCAAACTAQSAYNVKHPPSKGSPKTCQFYNTYVLSKNNVVQGQYCALYTQAWDISKATNIGQWRGNDHYTISQSIIASNSTNSGDISCPSDVAYLSSQGQDFCTAFISYVPPTSTVTVTNTPALSIVSSVQTSQVTATVYSTDFSTTTLLQTATITVELKRRAVVIQTPSSLSTWASSRIAAACSAVVSGVTTTTLTSTAATPISSQLSTTLETITATLTTTDVVLITATKTTTTDGIYSPTATLNTNGGFESSLQGWRVSSNNVFSIYYTPALYDGFISLSISPGQNTATPLGKVEAVMQTLTGLDPTSNLYGLSFYYSPNVGGAPCTLTADLGNTNLFTKVLQPARALIVNGRAVYVPVSVNFITPPSSTADLKIGYVCGANANNGVSVTIDDVSFTQGNSV